jgi:CRISPR/Cas system-associated exonuclease Cas4 (RecB family)
MVAIPEPTHTTTRAIYTLHEKRREPEAPRGYLGASEIGESCSRRLWYSFRWAGGEAFDGRMLRLFETGNREETRLLEELRAIGVKVEGEQFAVEACGGHLRGHLDAAVLGLVEAPKTWHVFEAKTHNTKSFKQVVSKGVRDAKPRHFAQLTVYMGLAGMTRAAYFAVCKDTDEILVERVVFDPHAFAALIGKAQAIIDAAEPPTRISEDPDWFECRFCPFRAVCHEAEEVPPPNCRTCAHSTPAAEGAWHCARHGDDIPQDFQRRGCDEHRYIPALAPFLEIESYDEPSNVLVWRNKLNGVEVRQPDYSSREIHKAPDKRLLGDDFIASLKTTFPGAELVARSTPGPEDGDAPASDLAAFYATGEAF